MLLLKAEAATQKLKEAKNKISKMKPLDAFPLMKEIENFLIFIQHERALPAYFDAKNEARLEKNINLVTAALEVLSDDKKNISEQWEAIRAIEYAASTSEIVWARTKKIISTVCTLGLTLILAPFVVYMLTSGSVIGAAYFGLSVFAAIWGGSASAAAFGSPIFFGMGFRVVKDHVAKKTNSPVENAMLKMKKTLIEKNQLDRLYSIQNKLGTLEEHSEIRSILEAVLKRAQALQHSAERWYTLDGRSRQTKASLLYHATEQVLTKITEGSSPQDILNTEVVIHGEKMSYREALNAPRHLITSCLRATFFAAKTHTLKEAEACLESPTADPSLMTLSVGA